MLHGPSAGQQGVQGHYSNVYQVEVADNGDDAHVTATRAGYVAGNVAPWILSTQWPPPGYTP